jgi:hypothetical protein
MAAPDTSPAEARIPWLSREGRFRFELGLRQSSGDFFKASANQNAILAARAELLDDHPHRHAAMLEDGADLLHRAQACASEVSGVASRQGDSPLQECIELGKVWEPDFLLLKPGPEGVHRLVGGCVCFPSSWDLHEKMGQSIKTIHAPVPTVNETLGTQISAFLGRIKPGAVWERWNWGVAAVDALNHHPALALRKLHASSTLADSWLRLEHQAFRSLDAHGGLLFAIRISLLSLTEIAQQREAALRLAELFETMPDDIATYKGLLTARIPLARQLRATA